MTPEKQALNNAIVTNEGTLTAAIAGHSGLGGVLEAFATDDHNAIVAAINAADVTIETAKTTALADLRAKVSAAYPAATPSPPVGPPPAGTRVIAIAAGTHNTTTIKVGETVALAFVAPAAAHLELAVTNNNTSGMGGTVRQYALSVTPGDFASPIPNTASTTQEADLNVYTAGFPRIPTGWGHPPLLVAGTTYYLNVKADVATSILFDCKVFH